jgi:alpha-1,2-mannosyltransferase
MERTKMRTTTKLLLLSLLNVAVMCGIWLQKPEDSAMQKLKWDLQGQVLNDSSEFMQEAWRVVHTGKPLYQTVFFEEHIKFQYPTSSLLIGYVVRSLGTTFYMLIKWLVLVSSILTMLLAGDIFLRLMPVERGERWKVRWLIASLGVFFYPLILSVRFGQIQTVLTFLFTLAVWLWMLDRKMAAGVCLAIACAVKPPLGLFLLWGLLRREWRFVWAFLGTVVLVQAVAIALFGWSNEVGYLAPLSYMGHRGECIGENQSVNGWLQRFTRNGEGDTSMFPPYNPIVYVGTVMSSLLFLVAGLVVPVWHKWSDPPGDFILFGLLSTIASPIVWTHHYGVFYVGCVYFLAMSLKQAGRIPAIFVVCFVLLANFFHLFGKYYWIRPENLVFSYVLYAGLGMILLMCFGLDHSSRKVREAFV